MPIEITFKPSTETEEKEIKFVLRPNMNLIIGREPPVKLPPETQFMKLESKVVSRAHVLIHVDSDNKILVKDTRSSAGTFLNGARLSAMKQESEFTPLKDGDTLKLGDTCEVQGVLHLSVQFQVDVKNIEEAVAPLKHLSRVSTAEIDLDEDDTSFPIELKNMKKKTQVEMHKIWDNLTEALHQENPLIQDLLHDLNLVSAASRGRKSIIS